MSGPYGWNPKPDKQIPKTQLGTKKGAVTIDPVKVDTLINQQGVRVKVYRSTYCPNVKDITSRQHNIDCDLCKGHGFIDLHPKVCMAVIQTQDLEKLPNVEGFVDGNSVAATFERGIELQYFTLVELCDFTDIFIDLVKRSRGPVDVLRYKVCNVNVLIDSTGKEYVLGSDFDLDVNGCIRWRAGRGPNPDTIYTIHYECPQRFRAVRAMHVNRYIQDGRKSDKVTMTKMPEQWTLCRDYLIQRTDRDGNTLAPNLIRASDEE